MVIGNMPNEMSGSRLPRCSRGKKLFCLFPLPRYHFSIFERFNGQKWDILKGNYVVNIDL